MNFVLFPVGSTNIFPIVNSHAGGQYATEWNLRSRESVGTDPSVRYHIGPSYAHSAEDFAISQQLDSTGVPISSTSLQISEGRALVNGHFVESLAPIVIDIAEANISAQQEGEEPLKGELCVGLRIMYSTETTMAGSMLVENAANLYEGVQIVILPKYGEVGTKFTLPSDSPTDESKVNAHLKLGEFTYRSGVISGIVINPDKTAVLSPDRISNTGSLVDSTYVSKRGLDPKKIYTFAGKGTDPQTGYDTWCDSLDSLIVWDAHPVLMDGENPGLNSAQFIYNPVTGYTQLHMPHKQPDGMSNSSGDSQYYADKVIDLPAANFGTKTGGTVTPAYTESIRAIERKIDNLYYLPQGKLKYYISGIMLERSELPKITGWDVGDYVLVNQDGTLDIDDETARLPATMYVVLPGYVNAIAKVEQVPPSSVIPASLAGGVQLGYYESETTFDPTDMTFINSLFDLSTGYRGIVNKDFFTVVDASGSDPLYYYYAVSIAGEYEYSEPVWVTGQIPFATETAIGGFLNVPETAYGNGYIYLTSDGHLRLLDYELLASGTLAYQLGQNYTTASGMDMASIQEELDEYVNNRVAFPNASQLTSTSDPDVIHVYVNLTEDDTAGILNIMNIDSRFNTSVYVHLLGSVSAGSTINFVDCQKLRIDNQLSGDYILNSYRCNLYYDAAILDELTNITELTLWYERFSANDSDLVVNDMTVEFAGTTTPHSDEYWDSTAPNDNHYSYALKSITFADNGSILGCKLLVTDNITGNVANGTYMSVFKFTLPQSSELPYPASKLTSPLKVTGTFITAYPISSIAEEGYKVKETTFSALSQNYRNNTLYDGQIAFKTTISDVTSISGIVSTSSIDAWQSGVFNQFVGGTVS